MLPKGTRAKLTALTESKSLIRFNLMNYEIGGYNFWDIDSLGDALLWAINDEEGSGTDIFTYDIPDYPLKAKAKVVIGHDYKVVWFQLLFQDTDKVVAEFREGTALCTELTDFLNSSFYPKELDF